MPDKYTSGVAFVFEGETEEIFYLTLIKYFCDGHPGFEFTKCSTPTGDEVYYEVLGRDRYILIKTDMVGTISQITNSGVWYENRCHKEHPSLAWTVFLCYDTDDYKPDITKFQEGDWRALRMLMKRRKAARIIDLATNADIEDLFLLDAPGIFRFMNKPSRTIPSGCKGKRKMRKLFRSFGQGIAYHSGERARCLIEALDMQVIIDHASIPLSEINKILFE
jgi:hypothetical protein